MDARMPIAAAPAAATPLSTLLTVVAARLPASTSVTSPPLIAAQTEHIFRTTPLELLTLIVASVLKFFAFAFLGVMGLATVFVGVWAAAEGWRGARAWWQEGKEGWREGDAERGSRLVRGRDEEREVSQDVNL